MEKQKTITDDQRQWLNKFIDRIFSTKRNDRDFLPFYASLYKEYKKELKAVIPKDELQEIEKQVENVYKKVREYIIKYLTANIASIHQSMTQWWFGNHFDKAKMYQIKQGETFYRIRIKEKEKVFHKEDMGYVPFHLRHILKNYRYSISGTPCLYMGSSVLGCWEEMRRPSINKMCVSKVKLMNDFNLLDLRLYRDIDDPKDFKNYIILFPLILACSVKVQKADDVNQFKSEYIIPQLFMQSIMRNKTTYNGIIYNSTQMDERNPYNDRRLYENIAIPVKSEISYNKVNDLMGKSFVFSEPVDVDTAFLMSDIRYPQDKSYEASIWRQIENLL